VSRYEVRRFIYGQVSEEEHALVKARAKAAGMSVSEFVRRAVNRELFDADEDVALIEELGAGRVRSSRKVSP
jgi:hypothetical protein